MAMAICYLFEMAAIKEADLEEFRSLEKLFKSPVSKSIHHFPIIGLKLFR